MTRAEFDFVVLTVNIPQEVSSYWQKEGMIIAPISNSSYFFQKKQSSFYLRAIMLKVEVLTLIQYEKVIFVDYDVFFKSKWDVTSMSKLIFGSHLLVGGSSWIRTPLMASTMVMTPSLSDRRRIIDILETPWTPEGGWCNCSIPGWTGLKNWDFHSGTSDQGILYYYYAFVRNSYLNITDGQMKDWAAVSHLNVGVYKPWRFQAKVSDPYDVSIDPGMLQEGLKWISLWKDFRSVLRAKGEAGTGSYSPLKSCSKHLTGSFEKFHKFYAKVFSAAKSE